MQTRIWERRACANSGVGVGSWLGFGILCSNFFVLCYSSIPTDTMNYAFQIVPLCSQRINYYSPPHVYTRGPARSADSPVSLSLVFIYPKMNYNNFSGRTSRKLT